MAFLWLPVTSVQSNRATGWTYGTPLKVLCSASVSVWRGIISTSAFHYRCSHSSPLFIPVTSNTALVVFERRTSARKPLDLHATVSWGLYCVFIISVQFCAAAQHSSLTVQCGLPFIFSGVEGLHQAALHFDMIQCTVGVCVLDLQMMSFLCSKSRTKIISDTDNTWCWTHTSKLDYKPGSNLI